MTIREQAICTETPSCCFTLIWICVILRNRRCVLCCGKRHGYNILPRGPFCELFGLVENEPAGWMSSMFGDKEALRGPRWGGGECLYLSSVTRCIRFEHHESPSALMLAVPAKSVITTITGASEWEKCHKLQCQGTASLCVYCPLIKLLMLWNPML